MTNTPTLYATAFKNGKEYGEVIMLTPKYFLLDRSAQAGQRWITKITTGQLSLGFTFEANPLAEFMLNGVTL
jgi:hypothetical protein